MRLLRPLLDVLRDLRRGEARLALVVLGIVVGLWVFAGVAGVVAWGGARSLDEWCLRALRRADDPSLPIGPAWLLRAARDITSLGGFTVAALLIACVAGYLWLERKRHAAVLVVAATIAGQLLSKLLKHLFGRDRPEVVPHLVEVTDPSFPSGHALQAAVSYLTLGLLLARFTAGLREKLYILTVTMGLAFLVGVTRVYLGVHYPTDVLAGWALGLVWALLSWMAARWLQRRGTVEAEGQR